MTSAPASSSQAGSASSDSMRWPWLPVCGAGAAAGGTLALGAVIVSKII